MTWNKHILWLILPLISFSCARQSTPTGGPKDTIPPVLISSQPYHEQVNFKGKNLELLFSELVVVNNPKEQMIITPSLGKEFKAEARKNKVLISFENDFEDSTTYTFNFRESIQDITEKNPARNLVLAISTGTYIDSMTVEGTVFNALDQKPMKDVTVAVQPYLDTFNIMKHPATFFTKSDEKGLYKLDNLKPGIYTIYAIADQNKNLIADSKNEAYGFRSDSIFLDNDIKNLRVNLTKLDTRPLKLTSARPYNTYFSIKASKNLKDFRITAVDSTDLFSAISATDPASIQLYNTLGERDSLLINLTMTDSVENRFDTTFYARFTDREVTPEKFNYEIKSSRLLADKGLFKLSLKFSKPVKEVNFDSLYLQFDSVNILRFTPADLTYIESLNTLNIEKKFDKRIFKDPPAAQPGEEVPSEQQAQEETKSPSITKNKLFIGKGAFISVENDSSKAVSQNQSPMKTEDMGVIYAEARPGPNKLIIQLLERNGTVKVSAVHKTAATFDDLAPADYQLRLIIDRNGNGVWDPGNYLKNQEPEEIHYWVDEAGERDIKLKANFEFGPLLITY